MKNNILIKWFGAIICLLTGYFLFSNGSSNSLIEEEDFAPERGVHINRISLSPDYKYITMDLDFLSEAHEALYHDASDTIRFEVKELIKGATSYTHAMKMNIVQKKDVVKEETANQKLKVMAVVDLTLPQPLVDEERLALQEIKSEYSDNILFVSFMGNKELSQMMPLTDYVLNNYFNSVGENEKYLLRSIVEKRDEMINDTVYHASSDNMALVVFSDGKVYDENSQPIDPKYYEYKEELDQIRERLVTDTLSIYYVNMDENADENNYESTALLRRMCKNYDGLYQEKFDWAQMEVDFRRAFELNYCDYRLTLSNPDYKIYRGNQHTLFVDIYDHDNSIIATDSITYSLGSSYDPIVVNGENTIHIIVQGLLLTLFLLLLCYIILQFVVPFIQYRIFLKRYVIEYQGNGMSVNGILVADTCYLCKDKFRKGDLVVAKCAHTVHKSCWDENEYRCPEYGTHCKTGIHYYNTNRLEDYRNASSHLISVLIGCLSAFFAWAFFLSNIHFFAQKTLLPIAAKISGLDMTNVDSLSLLSYYANELNESLLFGICLGFFNTLFFCALTVRNQSPWHRLSSIIWRSVLAAFGCSIFFFLKWVITLALNLQSYAFLIDWIPWSLSSVLVMYLCALHTGERLKRISILIVCIAGVISMNFWNFFMVDSSMDYRLLLLISFLFFSIILAACQSYSDFRSSHYFLSVTGGTKPMDVAIYKWFRTNPSGKITLGKSVDCDLQLSWEITGDVSPIHAEIRMRKGILRMYPLEAGVRVNGKPWPIGKGLRLYHGTSFTLGRTTFTYKEKDSRSL
jgi:hypothetical protein